MSDSNAQFRNSLFCSYFNHSGRHFLRLPQKWYFLQDMPFRCLAYVTDLLNKLIKNKRVLYLRFPSPKFFVLYDGNDFYLELIVSVININYGNAVILTITVLLSVWLNPILQQDSVDAMLFFRLSITVSTTVLCTTILNCTLRRCSLCWLSNGI